MSEDKDGGEQGESQEEEPEAEKPEKSEEPEEPEPEAQKSEESKEPDSEEVEEPEPEKPEESEEPEAEKLEESQEPEAEEPKESEPDKPEESKEPEAEEPEESEPEKPEEVEEPKESEPERSEDYEEPEAEKPEESEEPEAEKPEEPEPEKSEEPEVEKPKEPERPQIAAVPQKTRRLEDVKAYDADELKRELMGTDILEEEKTAGEVLEEIKEERRRLAEERAQFLRDMDKKKKRMKSKPKKEKKKEEKPPALPPEPVKSFAKERRKRKDLERIRTYLFGGEYVMVVILLFAIVYAEGVTFDPVRLPLENAIYIIMAFFILLKAERFYFRFLNMKYSGTLQRKMIGVDHFTGLEWPPIIGWSFAAAVFLFPVTAGIINLIVDLISFEREYIPFSDGFVTNMGLLFLVTLGLSLGWILFLRAYRNNVLEPEMKKIEEPFVVEDAFLITNSGLLIRHVTRELKPGVDDDILTGMLTAVKDFVKDSFRENEEGELDELQYGRLRIIIEYGREVYLALVVRGQESRYLRPEMKNSLKLIHRKYGRIFEGWDGNLAKVRGIENILKPLVVAR
ncbi:MAG: hypothetical protein JSW28_09630 [Thermoplasmata archaeon]|nr:MAG: hypothetical protein JSW28_09630 [Thermoplasmata archaeon]